MPLGVLKLPHSSYREQHDGTALEFLKSATMKVKARLSLMLCLLAVGVSAGMHFCHAVAEEATRKVAIVPFSLPTEAPEREWLSEGFPRVLALRLQQLPRLTVMALPRDFLSAPEGFRNPLDSGDAAALLERLRTQGYEAVILGGFHQLDGILRLEVRLWATRPERHLGKSLEQSPEKEPDGLGIKVSTFVASALQIPLTEADGRRLAERYTTSAEAFERFARALSLAETSSDEEDVSQAVGLFKEAISFDGKFSMALRQLGDLSFRHGHYVSAAEAYLAFLGLGKRSPLVYRLLGKSFFAQRDMARAIDAYKRGLQLEARDPQLYLDLGLAYTAVKDYESARKALLRALEFKPDDPLAFANLGVVYLLQGNFPAATASLRRAQLLQGSDARLTYNLGLSLMFEGVYDQARDQFERTLQLNPNFAPAAYQLALLTERLDPTRAIERWRKYLELANGKPAEQAWLPHAQETLKHLQQP
jgi:tetratricopeptide (TPR) repeat protein